MVAGIDSVILFKRIKGVLPMVSNILFNHIGGLINVDFVKLA